MHLKIPCPTMIKLFLISFIWSLHFMTQGRWREEKKFSHLLKIWKNLELKSPRPKLFVNKNAIKSNFGNCTNKVGNFQIGTERLREFGHLAWEFLRFGSSHTALLCWGWRATGRYQQQLGFLFGCQLASCHPPRFLHLCLFYLMV